MSSETKMSNSIIFGIIAVVASLLGTIAIALNWVDISILGSSALSYNGIDLLDIDDDDFQKYIPAIVAALSAISLILGVVSIAKKESGGLGIVSAVFGIIIVILAFVAYMWIDDGNVLLSASPDIGLYLAVIAGALMLVFGLLSSKS